MKRSQVAAVVTVTALAAVVGPLTIPATTASAQTDFCLQESFVPSATGGLHTIVECDSSGPLTSTTTTTVGPWSGPMDDTDALPPIQTEATPDPTQPELSIGDATGADEDVAVASPAAALGVEEYEVPPPVPSRAPQRSRSEGTRVPRLGVPHAEPAEDVIPKAPTPPCDTSECVHHGESGFVHAAVDRTHSAVDAIEGTSLSTT